MIVSIFGVYMYQVNKDTKMILNKEYATDLIKDFLAEGESLEYISELMQLPVAVIINLLNGRAD